MQRGSRPRVAALLLLAAGGPMLATLLLALRAALDASAWSALWQQPRLGAAWGLSLATGLAASGLALALAAAILARAFAHPLWPRLLRRLGPILALPHAAFAIGLVLLLAPSGWLLRLVSPWLSGLSAPPAWPTTQDPWGLGLVLALVAKEVPFLLWTAAAQLQRADLGPRLARELQVARSMGYAPRQAWWRVAWPQLLPRLAWPMLAVWAYGLTVVDVALVIGPGSPPTLAVLAWGWLNDTDPATQAVGAAAAWLLALTMAGGAWLAWWTVRAASAGRRRTDGQRGPIGQRAHTAGGWPLALLLALYAAVSLALALGSVIGVWPFPALWPETLTASAWTSVAESLPTVGVTLALGLAASATAMAWAVAWLELAPPAWDARLRGLAGLTLVLPAVLWVPGLHALSVYLRADAHWSGLWLAHTLACLPYTLIALAPAYTSVDPRLEAVVASLGRSRAAWLWHIKWPLLRPAFAGAFAVGFAVSVAQYLPTLYVGGGRYATVTTEAVALAAGGQRALAAAYAGLQWLLPAALFALAAALSRPRRFRSARGR